MRELICIVCPKGCHLQVDEEHGYTVKGNACLRGEEYGKNECQHPTRVLTSTVVMEGGIHSRLPVKSDKLLPKERLFDVMALLETVRVTAPVTVGDVILENVLGTGVNIVAARNM